jgi:hypothetical protein
LTETAEEGGALATPRRQLARYRAGAPQDFRRARAWRRLITPARRYEGEEAGYAA